MAYEEAVAQAASALKRGEDANWELARLTYENTISISGANSEIGKVPMRRWAEDVQQKSGRRFSYTTANRYKAIWARYGSLSPARGEGPTWGEAWLEIHGGDGSIADQLVSTDARRGIDKAPTEVRQEIAAKLLADPQVADAVIAQPEARRAVYESLNRREVRAEERREALTQADPISLSLDRAEAQLTISQIVRDFTVSVERFRRMTAETLRRAGPLPERDMAANRHFIEQAVMEAREALDSIETYLSTGKTDLDAFLDSVLGGSTNG
jgi:hypothetical protein